MVFVSLYLVETSCSWPHEADICCQIRGARRLCRLPASKDRKQVAEVSCQTEYHCLPPSDVKLSPASSCVSLSVRIYKHQTRTWGQSGETDDYVKCIQTSRVIKMISDVFDCVSYGSLFPLYNKK